MKLPIHNKNYFMGGGETVEKEFDEISAIDTPLGHGNEKRETTLSDRITAAKIITELYKQHGYGSRKLIAEIVGIKPIYVTFIGSMQKRAGAYSEFYMAPENAICKVLQFIVNRQMAEAE